MKKRNLMLVIIVPALAVIGAGLGGWWKSGKAEAEISLRPGDAALVSLGGKVYAENCASCHGDKLQGQPDWQTPLASGRYRAPPHNVQGHTWHHTDELLFRLTKFGPAAVIGNGHESDMAGYKDLLSDREILAVLSFIKSTWPHEVRRNHDLLNEEVRKQQGKNS